MSGEEYVPDEIEALGRALHHSESITYGCDPYERDGWHDQQAIALMQTDWFKSYAAEQQALGAERAQRQIEHYLNLDEDPLINRVSSLEAIWSTALGVEAALDADSDKSDG